VSSPAGGGRPTGIPDRSHDPVVILGVTGSIGGQALEVCAHLDRPVVAIAARNPSPELAEIARSRPGAMVVVTGGSSGERQTLVDALPGHPVRFGQEALLEVAGTPDRTVINGIVGAAGLRASVVALEAGNRLGLANKESLVVAGRLVRAAAERGRGELIPIDSEHSALFQLTSGHPARRLVLTASGGPFRGRSRADLADVSPEQALRHPTWVMGRRISIDSATLVNKGLEVIEAHHLFGIAYDDIDVVIHPQSVVHSLVEMADGAMLAHLGVADMRVPIQYALTHPERLPSLATPFRLAELDLTFEPPDRDTFRALDLAYAAGRAGDGATAAFNAADEVAVEAFLVGRLGFLGITQVIELTLEKIGSPPVDTVDEAIEVDRSARETAASLIAGVC
jgi:1-deoxy-D-xylulose-5-phosphate reductoisomerase